MSWMPSQPGSRSASASVSSARPEQASGEARLQPSNRHPSQTQDQAPRACRNHSLNRLCRAIGIRGPGLSRGVGIGGKALLIGCLLVLGVTLVGAANADSDKGGKSKETKGGASSAHQSPPPGVVVAAVQLQDVAAERRYIGTVKAIQSVDLRARVEGFLDQVAFKQGRTVKADQLLYQIEQDQYQAAMASAQGQLAAVAGPARKREGDLRRQEGRFRALCGVGQEGRYLADQFRPRQGAAR